MEGWKGAALLGSCIVKSFRTVWVPKTCATWADALQIAVGSVPVPLQN